MKRKDPWESLIKDIDSLLEKINPTIDIYACAHLVLPKSTSPKFIRAIQERGYSMTKLNDVNTLKYLDKNQIKKLAFYEISKSK